MKNCVNIFLKVKSAFYLFPFLGGAMFFSGLPVQAKAKQTINGFNSFTVEVKDTVYQGEPFEVNYVLEANNWKEVKAPKFAFCQEMARNYNTQNRRPFARLTAKHKLVVSQVGELTLPAATAIVSGREVQSETRTIYVAPNPKTGEEMMLAHRWLRDHGVPADSCVLQIERSNEELALFVDKYHGKFVVVARKAFWELLGQPVLAWSTESFLSAVSNSKDESSAYTVCIYPYTVQLRRLKAEGRQHASDWLPDTLTSEKSGLSPSKVTPLLGTVAWGQKEPFNQLSPSGPNGEKTLLGCVPVAMAQVMMYHKFPAHGVGEYIYTAPDEYKYRVDYGQFSPAWTELRPTYDKGDTASASAVAQLMMMVGMSIDAQYGENSTMTNFYNLKSAFCSNWGYSGHATLLRNDSTGRMFSAMRRDLEAGRPCMLSSISHAMVCDGYDAGFWHLNFGWNGYCNGWYRAIFYDSSTDFNAGLFSIALTGIKPQREEVTKSVTVTKAGMLAELLTDEEKETVTKLTVSGPLNSADVRLLRRMAGAPEEEILSWQGGALQDLDLGAARFVNDKKPYLTRISNDEWNMISSYYDYNTYGIGQSFSSQSQLHLRRKKYDMQNMDDRTWKLFRNDVGVKQDGYYYERKDRIVYANYVTSKFTISPYMFSDCSSLKNIIVPSNTQNILDCAFFNCPVLQRVTLSKSIYKIEDYVFLYCGRFEGIVSSVRVPHVSPKSSVKYFRLNRK